jgi:hypothetical protein
LNSSVIDNDYHETEIKQRIVEATSELNKHYVAMVAERMSLKNADILSRFIIAGKKESNISRNTVMTYIDGVVYLENYHQHKDLEKMNKNDLFHFLIVTENQKLKIHFIDGLIPIILDFKFSLNFSNGYII